MKTNINEAVLVEKLSKIEQARQWPPRTIANLERLIRDGDDFDLFRINPIKFGEKSGVTEQESIELFLQCAREMSF